MEIDSPVAEGIDPSDLTLTQRGTVWLQQFDIADRDLARRLVSSLTLVSHSAFELAIARLIYNCAAQTEGPIGLFATREIDPHRSYFEQASEGKNAPHIGGGSVDAVSRGADLGSEARVAAIIRNISKADKNKFLNHPTIETMRKARCRVIFIVDDIMGTGKRTRKFIEAIWRERTIRSWWSLKYIRFVSIAYTATERGARQVSAASCNPSVIIERACPTFHALPWRRPLREAVTKLCKKYGSQTSRPGMALGFGDSMGALIFEHGSPNNAPAVLWAPTTAAKRWVPLFPDRTVVASEQSAFPPEIVRRDPISLLVDVGQKRLAHSGALSRRGKIGSFVLIVLALVAKGVRKISALGFATGLPDAGCARILEKCVKWGFVTRTFRLTRAGAAELDYARRIGRIMKPELPPIGDEDYYPKALRRATGG